MTSVALPYSPDLVTGVVLAGGEGRRMGGVDKGLVTFRGRPMASYAVAALGRQCATVLVNANRNADAYAALGCTVVADRGEGFAGPLAGIATALAAARTPWVLFAPCDSPMVSDDLGKRLWAGIAESDERIAVASDGRRHQPVFALIDSALAEVAADALAGGERKIDRWYDAVGWTIVDCEAIADSFANVNRPDERAALEAKFGATERAAPLSGEPGTNNESEERTR